VKKYSGELRSGVAGKPVNRNRSALVLSLAVAGVVAAHGGPAWAIAPQTPISTWDFDGSSLTSDGSNSSAPDVQVETITTAGTYYPTPDNTAAVAFASSTVAGPNTPTNTSDSASPSNQSLRFGIGGNNTGTAQGKNSYNATFSNNGGAIQWADPTTGYYNTTVTWWAEYSSTSAFSTETLEYSTTGLGGPWTVGGTATLTASFAQYSYTLGDLTDTLAIDNNASDAFEIVFTGSPTNYTGSAGPNARVDLLQVSGVAVPEPTSAGLLGLAGLGLLGRRRRPATK
jgi:hypothetical protein